VDAHGFFGAARRALDLAAQFVEAAEKLETIAAFLAFVNI
jgi:hypothetical protein